MVSILIATGQEACPKFRIQVLQLKFLLSYPIYTKTQYNLLQ